MSCAQGDRKFRSQILAVGGVVAVCGASAATSAAAAAARPAPVTVAATTYVAKVCHARVTFDNATYYDTAHAGRATLTTASKKIESHLVSEILSKARTESAIIAKAGTPAVANGAKLASSITTIYRQQATRLQSDLKAIQALSTTSVPAFNRGSTAVIKRVNSATHTAYANAEKVLGSPALLFAYETVKSC